MDLSERDLQERLKRIERDTVAPTGTNPQDTFESPPRTVQVASVDDLPDPVNGRHPLEDDRRYHFVDEVQSQYGLELGENCELSVESLNRDRFIYTGTAAAIYGRGVAVSITRFIAASPQGAMFDVQADNTTEFNITLASFVQMDDIGTIDGFRVPSFDTVNFEWFDAGLTFTGTSEKITFKFCPFRNVTSAGVACISLDAAATTEIVKVGSCYFKNVQGDTSALYVDPLATITEIAKYTGNDHDASIADANVLGGQVGRDALGTVVESSYPLADSTAVGEIQFIGTHTITGSGAGLVELTPPTTVLEESERVSEAADGRLQYDGRPNETVRARGTVTVTGVNSEIELALAKNGTPINQPVTRLSNNATSAQTTASVAGTVTLTTGDYISVFGENVTGVADFDVTNLVVAL